jgi:peroxiredoxin Q/BCP
MAETPNLSAGEAAPHFNTVDQNGVCQDLAQLNSQGKSVILYFYPKDSTPGCTIQACDFRNSMGTLESAGYIVLGVSKDSCASHERFVGKRKLNFPLLMDEDMTIHNAYGAWREKKNYGLTYMGCARSTFVIDASGKLTFARYNVKAKGHVKMLMRELGIDG